MKLDDIIYVDINFVCFSTVNFRYMQKIMSLKMTFYYYMIAPQAKTIAFYMRH